MRKVAKCHNIISGAFRIVSPPLPIPPIFTQYSVQPQTNRSINQRCLKCYTFGDKKKLIIQLPPVKLSKFIVIIKKKLK